MSEPQASEKPARNHKQNYSSSNNQSKGQNSRNSNKRSQQYYSKEGHNENKDQEYRKKTYYEVDGAQDSESSQRRENKRYDSSGYNRQQNHQGNNPKGSKRSANYQQANIWKKKKENFKKLSAKDVLDKYTSSLTEQVQGFTDVISANSELLISEPQEPVNRLDFTFNPDEAINIRTQQTQQYDDKSQKHQPKGAKKKPAEWDDNSSADPIHTMGTICVFHSQFTFSVQI